MIDHVCFWHLVDIPAVAALVRYWTNASEGDETVYEKARAITRASKNVEVWSGSAQVGWPNALVTPVLRGSTVASVTF